MTDTTPVVPMGFTAPPNAPGQDVSRVKRAELHDWLRDLQRQDAAPPPWLELYDELLAERDANGRQRWDWRKALYIAWSSLPKDKREPKTFGGLANRLGVATSTIRMWRVHDPEIVNRISEMPRMLLMDHVADVLQAMVTVASEADPKAFQDRRLFLEITGNYQPSGNLAVSMTPISYIEVAEDDGQ